MIMDKEKKTKIHDFLGLINSNVNSEEFIREKQIDLEKIKSDTQFQKELKAHNALSHELRFGIYQLLEQQELCTCALAEIVKMSEPTITHHLKILMDADLIIAQKQGLFTIYNTKENFRKKNFPDKI
jgi:hypothetical protein